MTFPKITFGVPIVALLLVFGVGYIMYYEELSRFWLFPAFVVGTVTGAVGLVVSFGLALATKKASKRDEQSFLILFTSGVVCVVTNLVIFVYVAYRAS